MIPANIGIVRLSDLGLLGVQFWKIDFLWKRRILVHFDVLL